MKKKIFTLLTLALMSIGSAWAGEICSAQVPNSDPWVGTNTTGIEQTGCTLMWSGLQAGSNIVTVSDVAYFKFGSNSAYVQLKLTSGSFQAGDVLKATVTSNGGESKKEVNLKVNTSATGTVKVNSNETDVIEYALKDGDIEEDGSIKIYRADKGASNIRVAIFSVSRATETYTVTFDSGSNGTCLIANLTEASVSAGVTLPAVTANSGYAFKGWYTAADGGTKAGVAGDTYYPSGNITLYAQYAPVIDRTGYNSYYVAEGDEIVSGTLVVCDDITMEYSDGEYKTAEASGILTSLNANYVASVTTSTNGWGVTFTPSKSGKLSVAAVINGTKEFSITNVSSFDYYGLEDNSGYAVSSGTITGNKWTPAKKQYTIITIDVEAGTSYKFSVAGSKLAFYGFEFPQADITNVTITPKNLYTTFCSPFALNFTGVAGLEAYVVSGITASSVELTQVYEVPAGTGLILKQTSDAIYYDVPVVDSASDPGTNYLKAALVGNTITENAAYGLKDSKFVKLLAGVIPAGKAYLPASAIPAGAAELTLDFGGATAITNTNRTNDTNNGEIYNLAGQRVAQPTKGLYIVNGKKIVVK